MVRSVWRAAVAPRYLVKAAHDQLIETLGEMESTAVERRTGKNAIGDVSFGLNDTMVLIRNAGRTVLNVGAVARLFDKMLERRLESERKR